jgi:hypothetical protein
LMATHKTYDIKVILIFFLLGLMFGKYHFVAFFYLFISVFFATALFNF